MKTDLYEMYYEDNEEKIIMKGIYKGVKFYIKTFGAFPLAYIEDKYNKGQEWAENNINCHGGVTFYSLNNIHDHDINTYYIGWDYGHGLFAGGDFITMSNRLHYDQKDIDENNKNHKYTVLEVVADIIQAINELLEKSSKSIHVVYYKSFEEYEAKYGEEYNNGDLWDFSKEDLYDGAVDYDPDKIYWEIDDRMYETDEIYDENEVLE